MTTTRSRTSIKEALHANVTWLAAYAWLVISNDNRALEEIRNCIS